MCVKVSGKDMRDGLIKGGKEKGIKMRGFGFGDKMVEVENV